MKNSDFSDLCSGDRCITINAPSDRNNSYPSDNRNNDKDYGNYSGRQSSGNGSYSSGSSLTQEQQAIMLRNQKLMEGFTGQVLGGVVHDKRHCRDYSEKPQVNKEVLKAARKVDRENNGSAVNFILFHDCYLNDDDMYWLSSIFNTHTPKGLAVNMVDLSDNDIKLTRDHNLTYKDLPFFSFNSPYNTPRNIVRLDLSNNQIGNAGAKLLLMGWLMGCFLLLNI